MISKKIARITRLYDQTREDKEILLTTYEEDLLVSALILTTKLELAIVKRQYKEKEAEQIFSGEGDLNA